MVRRCEVCTPTVCAYVLLNGAKRLLLLVQLLADVVNNAENPEQRPEPDEEEYERKNHCCHNQAAAVARAYSAIFRATLSTLLLSE